MQALVDTGYHEPAMLKLLSREGPDTGMPTYTKVTNLYLTK